MTEDVAGQVAAFFRDRRYLEAAQLLAESGGADPDVRNLHNQAAALYKAGRFLRAVDLARRALRGEPHSFRTHYLLALALRDLGRLPEALEAFDRACQLDPASPRALYGRGITRFLVGQSDPAVADLRAALALEPRHAVGYFNLGVMLISQARWREAVEAFVHSLKLDPAASDEYARFLVDIGRAQVYEEVYGQGHRLKNMLGVLGDRLGRLAAEVSSRLTPAERAELVEIREKQSVLFSDLNTFLSTARRDQLTLDLVDLRELIADVLVACAGNLRAVQVRREFPEDLPEVVCDPDAVREAVLNLVLNAAEAMSDGGGRLTLELSGDSDRVELEVSDTGPGIPPDLREKVFRFGFSTKPFGSGLGLSQARRSVERHGGSLVIVPGGPGATLRLTLPVSPRIESGIEDLSLKPVLSEDLRELLVEIPEDEGLLLV